MEVTFCSLLRRTTMWGSGPRTIASLRFMWRLTSRPSARVEVVGAGLACCALEVEAAQAAGFLQSDPGGEAEPGPSILIVAGTVTTALEPAIERMHRELTVRGPVQVLAFGACSTSGGPYWDAPTVRNGIGIGIGIGIGSEFGSREGGVPVAGYLPGCPPRPEALNAELERLVDAMVDQ